MHNNNKKMHKYKSMLNKTKHAKQQTHTHLIPNITVEPESTA